MDYMDLDACCLKKADKLNHSLTNSFFHPILAYRKTSNISHSLVGNKIVDHSDVVGAVPTDDAPTTSSFSI